MKRTALLSVCLLFAVSGVASAQTPESKSMDMNKMDSNKMNKMDLDKMDKANTPGVSHSGRGVVKSVDPATGSITLAHEPIKTLNWPAMTMGFKVKDKALLDKVKPGDKVQFSLTQSGKDYVVTSIK